MAAAPGARRDVRTTAESRAQSEDPAPRSEVPGSEGHGFYKVGLTALNFTSFLLSLLLIEAHYTLRRASLSASAHPLGRLFLPRAQGVARDAGPVGGYYHSNQKKLLRMEAEDAFRLGYRTLAMVGVALLGALGMSLWVAGGVWRYVAARM